MTKDKYPVKLRLYYYSDEVSDGMRSRIVGMREALNDYHVGAIPWDHEITDSDDINGIADKFMAIYRPGVGDFNVSREGSLIYITFEE